MQGLGKSIQAEGTTRVKVLRKFSNSATGRKPVLLE